MPGVRATSAAALASARRRRRSRRARARHRPLSRSEARLGSVTCTALSLSTLTRTHVRAFRDRRRVYSVTTAMMTARRTDRHAAACGARALRGLHQRRPPAAGLRLRGPPHRLIFDRPLAKEGLLGFCPVWGAWGIGTYRKNDQIDVTWEVDGHPRVAHALGHRAAAKRSCAAYSAPYIRPEGEDGRTGHAGCAARSRSFRHPRRRSAAGREDVVEPRLRQGIPTRVRWSRASSTGSTARTCSRPPAGSVSR